MGHAAIQLGDGRQRGDQTDERLGVRQGWPDQDRRMITGRQRPHGGDLERR
jgi:hypothetical protein